MERTQKNRKRAAAAIAVIALIATMLGGTYAYHDIKQHKSNEFMGSTSKYEARLVEDFAEVEDWQVGDGAVDKKISVVNHGREAEGYGEVYVRIQLKEYMEIGEIRYTETEKRYMLDTAGKFVIFETEAEALSATGPGGAYEGHALAELTDAVTGRHGWFIETQDHDINGQMGKHVITEFEVGDAEKVIKDGPGRATDTNHHGTVIKDSDGNTVGFSHESEECLYKVHSWKGDADSRLDTRDYIEWQLNTGAIITVSEWLDPAGPYKGQPVGKWIVEDRDDSGWVYWGEALKPDGGQTANFMESVTLVKQPDGSFYYVIHTELEAVSLEELASGKVDWGDAGEALAGGAGNGGPGPGGEGGDPGDPGEGEDPGDGGEGGDPGDGGNGGDPEEPDTALPVYESEEGFVPFKHPSDPEFGDGWYGKVFYPDLDDPILNEVYHFGSIHLEDIIKDGVYAGVTVESADPTYGKFLTIGDDKHGKPSVIFSCPPTNEDLIAWMMTKPGLDDDFFIPIEIVLKRDDGKEATVTINLAWYESLITADTSHLG